MAGVKWSDNSAFVPGGDCQIGDTIMGLRAGTNYKFTFPSTAIKDGNGNNLLAWNTIGAPATNYLQFVNGDAGTPLAINALGSSTDVSANLNLQGAGVFGVNGLFTINGSTQLNAIIDDDTMVTATASNVPTAESVVAYVLAHPGGGGYYTWHEITGASASMAIKSGYIANHGSLCSLLLPATSTVGDMIALQGKNAGLFRVTQNAGQTIHFGTDNTTTGISGYLQSTNSYDSFILLCITDNTDWAVLGGPQGSIDFN